ncbi:MAG: 50S ribosomal protein L33 [Sandaracinaceae bacterium]|nr:50S ribosomal protein L33 [Sandaracinaceae bacterium]
MSRERVRIALVCERCEARNYQTTKARRTEEKERLTLRKFCPTCNAHTNHRESR